MAEHTPWQDRIRIDDWPAAAPLLTRDKYDLAMSLREVRRIVDVSVNDLEARLARLVRAGYVRDCGGGTYAVVEAKRDALAERVADYWLRMLRPARPLMGLGNRAVVREDVDGIGGLAWEQRA